MNRIISFDPSRLMINVNREFVISTTEMKPGPPPSFDGLNIGIATLEHDPPHAGEVHLDGDELLYIISGAVRITSDSNPGQSLELSTGDACIIEKGEWHKVYILEKTQLIHITPGSNNDHRG